MNAKEVYALRADAVYLLRGMGFKIRELAAIFKTTPDPIRKLEARGRRPFKRPSLNRAIRVTGARRDPTTAH